MSLLLTLQLLAELPDPAWTNVADGCVETNGAGHVRIFIWPGAPEREQSCWLTPLDAARALCRSAPTGS